MAPAASDEDDREPLIKDGAEEKEEKDKEAKEEKTFTSMVITLIYCLIYLLVGPALILVNKQLLKDAGFGYPMMVSGLGQAASAIGAFVSIRLLGVQPLQHEQSMSWTFYLQNMMVVGGATAASLCFGNAGCKPLASLIASRCHTKCRSTHTTFSATASADDRSFGDCSRGCRHVSHHLVCPNPQGVHARLRRRHALPHRH